MNKDQKTFLSLVGCGASGNLQADKGSYEINDKVDFLAHKHQCIPLAYQGCVLTNTSAYDFWKKKTAYSAINNVKKLAVQKKVCDALSDAGIPFAIFKGSSLAVLYPNPDIRSLGDIDILVSESEYERAILQFVDEIKEEDAWHKFHFQVLVDGVEVEIHKHITYKTDDEAGKKLLEFMSGALDEVVYKKYDTWEFPTLMNKYHAVALLLHKKRHFEKNNITLRMVCDWALFVKSVSLTEWENEVYPAICSVGLDRFADSFTLFADKFLGFHISKKTGNYIDEKIIDLLMEMTVNSGISIEIKDPSSNFGALYSSHIEKSGRLLGFFKAINDIARARYSLANLSAFLPIFWLYIPILYLLRRIFGKRKSFNVRTAMEIAEKRNKLYNSLLH